MNFQTFCSTQLPSGRRQCADRFAQDAGRQDFRQGIAGVHRPAVDSWGSTAGFVLSYVLATVTRYVAPKAR